MCLKISKQCYIRICKTNIWDSVLKFFYSIKFCDCLIWENLSQQFLQMSNDKVMIDPNT